MELSSNDYWRARENRQKQQEAARRTAALRRSRRLSFAQSIKAKRTANPRLSDRAAIVAYLKETTPEFQNLPKDKREQAIVAALKRISRSKLRR